MRQQTLTKRGKTIHNWKKIGGVLVICAAAGVFTILGIIYGSQWFGRAVQRGDTVFIYYELRLHDGTLKDYSKTADGTSFTMTTGPGGVIEGFYENVVGMREGATKSFTIPACPVPSECPDYKGYTSGELAYQELNFFVRIVRFP